MKSLSAPVLTMLSTGQYVQYDLYKFSLPGGQTLYVADSDFPLTVSGQLYQHGLIIKRGKLSQENSLSVQQMQLEIAPQLDIPGGPPAINGSPFLAAARQGLFDGAVVQYSRLLLYPPFPPYTNWPDPTIAATPWFTGVITEVQVGRLKATFQVHTTSELLNVQMPRNLVQAGCSHMLYDAGCTLAKATFRVSGTVASPSNVLSFNSNLTQANDYFDLGVVTFTSGVNNGVTRTVRTYLNSGGNVRLLMPLNTACSVGDTFTILPGCDKQQATCSGKFSNLAHFRGMPYVPVPETLYDGTAAPPDNSSKLPGVSGPGGQSRYTYKP